jgi:hypothetical protein
VIAIPLRAVAEEVIVPKRPTTRLLSDDSLDEDKTTLWVRASDEFPLVPKEPSSFPLVPKDRPSDSRVATVAPPLSRTLRPIAEGIRAFPFAYFFSTIALGVAGVALYYARALPFEPARKVAATKTIDVAPAPPPRPPPLVLSIAPPPPAASSKPSIDVMSLPTAPPASRVRSSGR